MEGEGEGGREREREGGDVDRQVERCVCVREREKKEMYIILFIRVVTQGKHAYILWQAELLERYEIKYKNEHT